MSNQRNRRLLGVLLGVALGVGGCNRKLTPEQAEPLLEAFNHKAVPDGRFKCQAGERDWDYICQFSHSAHTSSRPGAPPVQVVERVGVQIQGTRTYQGMPLFYIVPIPDQGPVPSIEEARAQRKALLDEHAKKAAEEVRKNMAERRRSVPQSEESAR